MAKMTNLEMVQNILSAMDSDNVNSISDTVESDQVATILKETYFDLINNVLTLPEHEEIVRLEALGDVNKPNYLKLQDTIKEICLLRYNNITTTNTDTNYEDLTFLYPSEFQKRFNGRTESDSNITAVTDFSGVTLLIQTDKKPEYYTTFDDQYIICDSYDSSVDSTLQNSKTFCLGILEPTWTHTDSFVPDLDANVFPLLLEEAKATCFVNLKQVSNGKAEQKSRRQLTQLQNKTRRIRHDASDRLPDYGRK